MKNLIKKLLSYFTVSHKGVCSICDKEFDDSDLHPFDELYLCMEDSIHYQNHEWYLLAEALSDPENPEAALNMQNRKDELKKKNIKSYILTSYIENDGEIITKFDLYREA